jgi:hypothetical protein
MLVCINKNNNGKCKIAERDATIKEEWFGEQGIGHDEEEGENREQLFLEINGSLSLICPIISREK